MKSAKIVVLVVLSIFVFLIEDAYPYIDPGTGSYIFQVLIGFLVASLFAVKIFWQRIKAFFASFSHRRKAK